MRSLFARIAASWRQHPVSWITWAVILGGWQVASMLAGPSTVRNSPIVPSWQFIFTDALRQLSGSWKFDFWAPNPSAGGQETYLGAVLAIAYHSALSLQRLIFGLVVGVVSGVGTALAISYWRFARRLVWTPLNFLRMVPLLAAIPLFQFWFGATLTGTTVFIGFGVWVLLMVSTINAVNNVPDRFIESARTLGAGRPRTYFSVIVPASLPELRTSLLLAAGLSWSLTVGSEYIGMPTGLGAILAVAEFTTNTGRMLIIAIFIAAYALITFAILDRVFRRMVRWVPSMAEDSKVVRVAGAAGVGAPADNALAS